MKVLRALLKWMHNGEIVAEPERTADEQRAFDLGFVAWHEDNERNPFPTGTPRHGAWKSGWESARYANNSSW